MGIPYYFASLIKNHKNIVKKLESINNIDNLYLDSNSIIYDSIDFTLFKNKSQFENLLIQKIIDKIQFIIKTINYEIATGANVNIVNEGIKNVCNDIISSRSKMKDLINIEYMKFIIKLQEYEKEFYNLIQFH